MKIENDTQELDKNLPSQNVENLSFSDSATTHSFEPTTTTGVCRRKSLLLGTMRYPTVLLSVLLSAIVVPVALAQPPCFDTLGSLNIVMATELIRIRNGADPQPSYTYNLCANTFIDASTTVLEPVLNNAIFVCGDDGSRQSGCVILGGSVQVRIADSTVNGYPLSELTFMGITFSSFLSNDENTGTSIAAFASSTTTATFTDCQWQEFSSDFVILQSAEGSFFGPMTVQLEGGAVTAGTAGSVFSNDGGLLRISQIDAVDVTAAALVSTANNGASFFEKSTVSRSDISSISFTTAGGSQTVLDTTVSEMNAMEDAFYVEDIGSTLLLQGLDIEQNRAQTTEWSAVSVRTNAIARVIECSISDNRALEFGIVVFDSTVTIEDSFISRNMGSETIGTTSAPIFAITEATVNMERVEMNENRGFSGLIVALIRSTVRINKSCFQGGASEFVVFIANDSNFEAFENYVDSFSSTRCQSTGPRLFQEDASSGCFLGSSRCEGECLVVADQDSCLAQAVPTISPSILAPVPVTTAPTLSPVLLETPVPSISPAVAPILPPAPLSPTSDPTVSPTVSRTQQPTPQPGNPTQAPTTANSTDLPTADSTITPSFSPTGLPTPLLGNPTFSPTTVLPTRFPTFGPTIVPTESPTGLPTPLPGNPTLLPSTTVSTRLPTVGPTIVPTVSPTGRPTPLPGNPTLSPATAGPTRLPTLGPTNVPTVSPTGLPTPLPGNPTLLPSTSTPTSSPSARPSTLVPTSQPTVGPTTAHPSKDPSPRPTVTPSDPPSTSPAPTATPEPSPSPTFSPQPTTSLVPSFQPSVQPTLSPMSLDTFKPTGKGGPKGSMQSKVSKGGSGMGMMMMKNMGMTASSKSKSSSSSSSMTRESRSSKKNSYHVQTPSVKPTMSPSEYKEENQGKGMGMRRGKGRKGKWGRVRTKPRGADKDVYEAAGVDVVLGKSIGEHVVIDKESVDGTVSDPKGELEEVPVNSMGVDVDVDEEVSHG